jgi:hypothetical protein
VIGESVEEPGGAHADDEGEEELVGEEHGEGEAAFVDLFHDGFDGDEDGGEEEVAVRSWLVRVQLKDRKGSTYTMRTAQK